MGCSFEYTHRRLWPFFTSLTRTVTQNQGEYCCASHLKTPIATIFSSCACFFRPAINPFRHVRQSSGLPHPIVGSSTAIQTASPLQTPSQAVNQREWFPLSDITSFSPTDGPNHTAFTAHVRCHTRKLPAGITCNGSSRRSMLLRTGQSSMFQ
jgi:hypothetical protein